jgi:tRNA(fMet)-specific endonuclease VapC
VGTGHHGLILSRVVVMSAVTLAELDFAIACSGLAVQAAEAYGQIRAAHKDRHRDALDKLIAAHAVAFGATLVTHHEADFVSDPQPKVDNGVTSH